MKHHRTFCSNNNKNNNDVNRKNRKRINEDLIVRRSVNKPMQQALSNLRRFHGEQQKKKTKKNINCLLNTKNYVDVLRPNEKKEKDFDY